MRITPNRRSHAPAPAVCVCVFGLWWWTPRERGPAFNGHGYAVPHTHARHTDKHHTLSPHTHTHSCTGTHHISSNSSTKAVGRRISLATLRRWRVSALGEGSWPAMFWRPVPVSALVGAGATRAHTLTRTLTGRARIRDERAAAATAATTAVLDRTGCQEERTGAGGMKTGQMT